MLVACALFVLVITLTFGYLIPASKAAYRFRERSHLQQSAVIALSHIGMAAATTSPSGFSWSAASDGAVALGFNPWQELQAANGLLRWQDSFEMFWWDQDRHELRRRRWPPGPPTPTPDESTLARPKRLLPARLAEVVQTSAPALTLAYGVTDFSVEQQGVAGELIQPVTVRITLVERGRELDPDGALTVTHSLAFHMVNQQ
jgi:hypothetical protein